MLKVTNIQFHNSNKNSTPDADDTVTLHIKDGKKVKQQTITVRDFLGKDPVFNGTWSLTNRAKLLTLAVQGYNSQSEKSAAVTPRSEISFITEGMTICEGFITYDGSTISQGIQIYSR